MKRIGFIIGRQLNEIRWLHPDRITGGGSGLMRFGWVADEVNRAPDRDLFYEMYRPWHRYDLLVFMKAMGPPCMRLIARGHRRGVPAVFDANVNYYEAEGRFYFEGMRPSAEQTRDAVAITKAVDAVIADSTYLARMCGQYHPRVEWISDNVNLALVPDRLGPAWRPGEPLRLIWSGQAVKLFELLAVEEVLRRYRDHVRLVLVTNSLSAMNAWYGDTRARLERLLRDVPHDIVPFESLAQLWRIYASGGVCFAPRQMDNTYNLGHTEWRITLGMAARCLALGSPVPSYLDLERRAGGRGLRICHTPDQWTAALDAILGGPLHPDEEGEAARAVVERFYSTTVIAAQHAALVRDVLRQAGASAGGGLR